MYKTDIFIFLDDVQYTKKDWRNRNRIRTKDGFLWLTVPIIRKGLSTLKINEVKIDNTQSWAWKHYRSLETYYSKAPYWGTYRDFLKDAYQRKWDYLIDLTIFFIDFLAKEFNIHRKKLFSSKINVVGHQTEKIVNLCKNAGADYLYDGAAARNFIEENILKRDGITVEYQNYIHPVYRQQYKPFIPYMSAIDLLLNHGDESLDILAGKKNMEL